jgi:catechol 2,3-dioxygenase-like lactoylglutathione lyase family enzyme
MNTDQGIMRIKGINHLGLEVSDLEESRRFYCDILGMKEFHRDSARGIYLYADGDILTLQRASGKPCDCNIHFGFLMDSFDEIEAWKSFLEARRVHIENEVRNEHGWSIYINDPDGYLIEIFHVRDHARDR